MSIRRDVHSITARAFTIFSDYAAFGASSTADLLWSDERKRVNRGLVEVARKQIERSGVSPAFQTFTKV
jgi:hypothetical protein